MIANFSRHSAHVLHDTLATSWGTADGRAPASEPAPPEPSHVERGPVLLDSGKFARALRRVVRRIEPERSAEDDADDAGRGWLLISRNEIPPVFMGQTGFRFHGQAVHHSEQQIVEYVRTLDERADYLQRRHDRATLLIPSSGDRWFWHTKFFSMSETPNAARVPNDDEKREIVDCFREWVDLKMVRQVIADEYDPPSQLGELGTAVANEVGTERLSLTILPDVWIALSGRALELVRGEGGRDSREAIERTIVDWAARMVTRRVERQRNRLKRLQEWLDGGEVLAITVSAAELNPRYRGRQVRNAKHVEESIIHWALAYQASSVASAAPPM